MINKFKALDNIGLISYLHKLVLAIRQFFATKSEIDVVATALTDLDARKVDVSDLVNYDVTVAEQGESGNILKSYVISQGGSVIGTISIPKDLIVSSGSVVVGDWVDGVFTENASGTGKAIKLVISNQSEPIYINVQDLANVYTAQQGATEIQLAISNTNEISATLVKSVRDKINNAITTSNYNSYSPTLTGTGATGTWGINISGNANTATSVDWRGVTNKPVIGNGRLILKNGNDIISDNFTANIGNDITIDLNSKFTNKSDFELLGSKVDKIDTSIAELNAKTQVTISSDDSSDGEDEEIVEAIDTPFSKQIGTITLRFWNIERYENLPVYDVWVNYVTDVVGPFGYVNYCYEIFLVIDIYDYLNSIVSSVGFTSGIYKPFFIRGANSNNHVCGFDIRGNGNINTAIATVIGRYMHLKCHLQLHRGDNIKGNNIGEDIMVKAKNKQFDAYLCLRQTI